MAAKSQLRGHEMEYLNGVWVYSDTKEPTAHNERGCGFCGKENTKEGHDGCLGALPGLMNACCGHGNTKEAYVQFDKYNIIQGEKAMQYISKHKSYNL